VNPPKLLIDENLSPNVAVTLRQEGIDAVFVRDRGMNGASDATVLDLAFREDRILVTSNVDDFVKLVRARDLHAGLVLLEESGLTRQEQLQRSPACPPAHPCRRGGGHGEPGAAARRGVRVRVRGDTCAL
jgi:predicted nuclease of predicted toxin-antitoxin system